MASLLPVPPNVRPLLRQRTGFHRPAGPNLAGSFLFLGRNAPARRSGLGPKADRQLVPLRDHVVQYVYDNAGQMSGEMDTFVV